MTLMTTFSGSLIGAL